MEIELLWPLVQELVQSTDISSEDWAFLRQNAETLGCSEDILRAMVNARLAQQDTEPLRRIQALGQLVDALGQESSRKLPFLLEVAQTLHLSVQLVQTMVQMPRTPALRYLVRLLQSVEGLGSPSDLLPWLEEQTKSLKLPPQLIHYLLQLLEATQKKSLAYALQNYWEVLRLLDKHGLSAVEVAYLMDLAREARIADPVSQGLQEFLRLRARGASPLEGLAHLIRSFVQKGLLSEEEIPFLSELAQQEGMSQTMVHALVEAEQALRQRTPGGFGAEVLQPLIRTLLVHGSIEEPAMRLLVQRGSEVGLTRTHIEAILDLEQQILEKKAKFPQSLQPLIRALVEDARISDDRLVYLIKKAQEMGGSDKVVRSLVQIEIAAQKKARQEKSFFVPPLEQPKEDKPAPPPIPTPYISFSPSSPPEPIKPPIAEAPPPIAPPPPPPPPSSQPKTSTITTTSVPTLSSAFPKGG
ncbi:MAG: hypothetical protein NZ580_04590, partial [Bacteroidia bacterium]|nr:hypothetical protein [Bacteroidia bacterium]